MRHLPADLINLCLLYRRIHTEANERTKLLETIDPLLYFENIHHYFNSMDLELVLPVIPKIEYNFGSHKFYITGLFYFVQRTQNSIGDFAMTRPSSPNLKLHAFAVIKMTFVIITCYKVFKFTFDGDNESTFMIICIVSGSSL